MRYLAESRRSGLWPTDTRERGLVDQWLTWQAAELNPRWTYAVRALLRKDPAYSDPGQIELSLQNWSKAMRLLDAHLERAGGLMANGRISLADIAIALSSHRWLNMAFDKPELPAVIAHHRMMRDTEAGAPWLRPDVP